MQKSDGHHFRNRLSRYSLRPLLVFFTAVTLCFSWLGYCYDNAVMERFFWSLKHEWTNHHHYADLEDARISVFKYIETFYNTERIHQTLDYVSPCQFEENYHQTIAV